MWYFCENILTQYILGSGPVIMSCMPAGSTIHILFVEILHGISISDIRFLTLIKTNYLCLLHITRYFAFGLNILRTLYLSLLIL